MYDDGSPLNEADKAHVISSLTHDLLKKAWSEASKHYLGSGLEAGKPSFKPAQRAHKFLLKQGERLPAPPRFLVYSPSV